LARLKLVASILVVAVLAVIGLSMLPKEGNAPNDATEWLKWRPTAMGFRLT
jgi:hypothetical protein